METIKNKNKLLLENKINDITNLKDDLIGIKLEKEKYFHEYNSMKREYDKLLNLFREENGKYIRKFEDAENEKR
jgi:hypothetical protein